MNRRKFILGTVIGGAAITGAGWFSVKPHDEPLTIDFLLTKLDSLMIQSPTTVGEWNLYEIFTHCAQSVEYSMLGFPEHKPEMFKKTIGKIAFKAFTAKGKMTHALNEVIPGAPAFSQDEDIAYAFERFKKSLLDFAAYTGTLAPHFAYGELSKMQYEIAHVMHFNNHLSEIKLTEISA